MIKIFRLASFQGVEAAWERSVSVQFLYFLHNRLIENWIRKYGLHFCYVKVKMLDSCQSGTEFKFFVSCFQERPQQSLCSNRGRSTCPLNSSEAYSRCWWPHAWQNRFYLERELIKHLTYVELYNTLENERYRWGNSFFCLTCIVFCTKDCW